MKNQNAKSKMTRKKSKVGRVPMSGARGKNSSKSNDIPNLIERYRCNAIGMDDISDTKRSNKCHDKWRATYKILRETEEGRQAILQLLVDHERSVRCAAAAHSLQWQPVLARQVLDELRDSNGLCSFEAEMILKEYDAGRLTFDY